MSLSYVREFNETKSFAVRRGATGGRSGRRRTRALDWAVRPTGHKTTLRHPPKSVACEPSCVVHTWKDVSYAPSCLVLPSVCIKVRTTLYQIIRLGGYSASGVWICPVYSYRSLDSMNDIPNEENQ